MTISFATTSGDRVDSQEPDLLPQRLADLLLRAARINPSGGVRVVHADRQGSLLTYRSLLDEASCIAGGLQSLGRAERSKVAILLDDAGDFIPALWGCFIGGYVPCVLVPMRSDPARWATHLEHVDVLLEQPIFLTTGRFSQELPAKTVANIGAMRQFGPLTCLPRPRPQDSAIIILTSGSTGNAKGVALTHGNVLASMQGKSRLRRLTATDVVLNWVPSDHVTCLLESHMIAVYSGSTWLHVDAAEILSDPLLFLRLIDRHRVSISLAPNFLIGQINAALESGLGGVPDATPAWDLSCVRHIITGGEANVVETGKRFLDRLAPWGLSRRALYPGFGMTETCAGVTYSTEFPEVDVEAQHEFATVGYPIRGFEMRVVDEHDEPQAEGEAGELQLRGPMVFSGYYNNEEATRAAFTEDGWFRTGDLARIDAGRLNLVGRNKDCIIVSGVNYFSHELEAALEQLEGVERSFVAAFPTRPSGADTEQLVVAFSPACSSSDEAKLHQAVAAIRNTTIMLWGFRPSMVLPLPRHSFPKTSLGKIQRSLMRKRFEAGDFGSRAAYIAEVTARQLGGYSAPRDDAESAIAEMYAEIFGLKSQTLSATASFFDLGGTSLDIIRLNHKLSQRFGISDLALVTVLQNPTARALAKTVAPGATHAPCEYDPIVPLQTTGSKTPLFCVHPAIGEILVFVNLAKYFVNERPFYALRARGFNEGEAYFESVEEMVGVYLDAIRRVQPHGPYALAGYSFGAMVAFELGKRLEALGETVAFVGSIDMPPRTTEPVCPDYCAISLAFFLGLIDKKLMLDLHSRFQAADPLLCRHLFDLSAPARLTELNLDLQKFQAWSELALSLSMVGRAYLPSGKVQSVCVLYSQPRWGTMDDWLYRQLRAWDDHTREANRYILVAGEHHSLLGAEHVATFQAVLRAELDRALDGR